MLTGSVLNGYGMKFDFDSETEVNVEIQTRSEDLGLGFHETAKAAFKFAETEPTVWKISFDLPNGERVRFVRTDDGNWKYEDLMDTVARIEAVLPEVQAATDAAVENLLREAGLR